MRTLTSVSKVELVIQEKSASIRWVIKGVTESNVRRDTIRTHKKKSKLPQQQKDTKVN